MTNLRTAFFILLGFCALVYATVVWVEKPIVRHFPGVTMAI